MAEPKWKHVWITGASSGLGEGVARILAKKGCHVSITARSEDKLAAIAADFGNVTSYPGDVTDPERLKEIVAQAEETHGPIDLTIFCAGAWFPSPITKMKVENFAKTVDVNLMGVVYALDAVLDRMIERGSGHISWVSSVAGYGGLPNSAAYGSTKAALIHLAESVRPELERKGLTLSLINPGFVKTPMTNKNDFPMPFIMEPDDAAEAMVSGLEREKFEVVFPWQLKWILKFMNILPYPLYFWITRKMVG
ncbi:SDR family NAD(P)-dependent oxidoreductase [Pseudahrensia aquimaris]|uniref:SDR family NAD(P)-dependent oxidoreductase n=1 Tax=Pseudahrensia aquimaris TaxID=744461 RepID=A0ABW3FHL6_9HYPH